MRRQRNSVKIIRDMDAPSSYDSNFTPIFGNKGLGNYTEFWSNLTGNLF